MSADLGRLAWLIANSPHNLVSRGERPVIASHIDESVAVGRVLPLVAGARWVDLGTGGGLPGLALAASHPHVEWTLLDAVGKKAAAVRAFAGELGLDNVTVVHGRAEALAREPEHRGAYDGVVSRAVAELRVLVELGRGFLSPGGVLAAVKGPRWRAELRDAAEALRVLRLETLAAQDVPNTVRATTVVMLRALGPPPTPYPRPPGIPRAKPLGRPSS